MTLPLRITFIVLILPCFAFSQGVGINTSTPQSMLDVEGGVSIGSTYSGTTAAPAEGAIIEGFVGIGTTTPEYELHVSGGATPANIIVDGTGAGLVLRDNDGTANEKTVQHYIASSNIWRVRALNDVLTETYAGISFDMGTGFIGIGTSAANGSLHIKRETAVASFNPGAVNTALIVQDDNAGSAGSLISIIANAEAASSAQVSFGTSATPYQGRILYGTNAADRFMSIWTNSAERIRIESGGNVGIGITDPKRRLHIAAGTNPEMYIEATGGDADEKIWGVIVDAATDRFRIASVDDAVTTSVSGFVIDRIGNTIDEVYFPNGDVGVGTSAPADKFEVYQSIDGGDASMSITNGFGAAASTDETATLNFNVFNSSTIKTAAFIRAGKEGDFETGPAEDGFLSFYTRRNGTGTEAVRITSAGDIGINTDSPKTMLHIMGNAATPFAVTSSNGLAIQRNLTTTNDAGISIISGNAAEARIWFGDAQNEFIGRLEYYHTDNSMRLSTNGGERLIIESNGDFGVGTTTATHKLTLQTDADNSQLVAGMINNSGTALWDIETDGSGNTFQEIRNSSGTVQWMLKSSGSSYTLGGNFGIGLNSPSSELDVAGDVEVGSADAFYLGDPTTDGSWRIIRSGSNLLMERRESGSWVTKNTITP